MHKFELQTSHNNRPWSLATEVAGRPAEPLPEDFNSPQIERFHLNSRGPSAVSFQQLGLIEHRGLFPDPEAIVRFPKSEPSPHYFVGRTQEGYVFFQRNPNADDLFRFSVWGVREIDVHTFDAISAKSHNHALDLAEGYMTLNNRAPNKP